MAEVLQRRSLWFLAKQPEFVFGLAHGSHSMGKAKNKLHHLLVPLPLVVSEVGLACARG